MNQLKTIWNYISKYIMSFVCVSSAITVALKPDIQYYDSLVWVWLAVSFWIIVQLLDKVTKLESDIKPRTFEDYSAKNVDDNTSEFVD